ncbi:MAG TPA: hypothetical protein VFY87_23645 [Geminicoccaceae bacterium]|nr:hypothetical protein [Geminicoccaceae bacterium]
MVRLGWRWLAACGAALGVALTAGAALAGSAWFSLDREKIVCDVLGTGTCTVELAWTVSKEDKFDKWKICWKEREASSWLDDHCDYNSKVRKIENNFYAIPDLDMDKEYRVKLEARRERNENWTCVIKTMIRQVGHTAWLGDGGICVDF